MPRGLIAFTLATCLSLALVPGAEAGLQAGDVLVADSWTGLLRFDATTHAVTVFVPPISNGGVSLGSALSVAVGPGGEVYLLDGGASAPAPHAPTVWKIDPASGSASAVSVGGLLQSPFAMAVGPNGTIYVSEIGANGVIAISPASGAQSIFNSGTVPTALAVDESGTVYVGRVAKAEVDLYSAAGSALAPIALAGLSTTTAIAETSDHRFVLFGLDPDGLTDAYLYDPAPKKASFLLTFGASDVYGVATEPNGDIVYGTPGGSFAGVGAVAADGSFSWVVSGYHNPIVEPHGVAIYGVRSGVVPTRATSWGTVKAAYHH